MKLEDQVVGLELAKRLKELGVKQESAFFWQHLEHSGVELVQAYDVYIWNDNEWAAFTVAELGEMLPKYFRLPHRGKGHWFYFVEVASEKMPVAPTEAEARAQVLIYLLENKLMSPTSLKGVA